MKVQTLSYPNTLSAIWNIFCSHTFFDTFGTFFFSKVFCSIWNIFCSWFHATKKKKKNNNKACFRTFEHSSRSKKLAVRKNPPFWKIKFFLDLNFRNRTYIQTIFPLKNHNANCSNQARCVCSNSMNPIFISNCTDVHNRHQPSPSIYSIEIWHARYPRLTQRATLTK